MLSISWFVSLNLVRAIYSLASNSQHFVARAHMRRTSTPRPTQSRRTICLCLSNHYSCRYIYVNARPWRSNGETTNRPNPSSIVSIIIIICHKPRQIYTWIALAVGSLLTAPTVDIYSRPIMAWKIRNQFIHVVYMFNFIYIYGHICK